MARKYPDHPDRPGSQAVPAPDDLAGWKAADYRLFQRITEQLKLAPHLWAAPAVKRYFGDEDLKYFLDEHDAQGVAAAYASWAILDYRPSGKSQTQATKMLAEGLPEAEAILLRARMEAHPSLYRVAGHDPKAGTIDLEDVLLGGVATGHDRLMSESIENGLFITVRIFPAGRFHFLELAGPPLGAGMGMEALDYLRQGGMDFTRDGLRRDSYMFGWLWDWIDSWEANRKMPHLTNTDGEDILLHTAAFSVADETEVRRALLQRADIDHDEENDDFTWFAEKGQGARTLGGSVTLGTIELVAGELVLSVNSASRLAAARQWLETLPGVVFEGVKTRQWNEPAKDRPMDERISKPEPVEMTPQLTAAVQEMMNKQYMAWVDMPLPVLGGKSPRQVCQTPSGRQQVAMLIRTIPDPMGPAPVRVPREAMRKELGLAGESSPTEALKAQEPVFPGPTGAAAPFVKVGRNDPCPCGSGRKYKKCCGR